MLLLVPAYVFARERVLFFTLISTGCFRNLMHSSGRIRLFLLLFLSLVGADSLAWSSRGHAQLTQLAFESLSEQQRAHFTSIVNVWIKRKPKGLKAMQQRYPHYDPVALLSIWPDRIRDMPINAVMRRYAVGRVPEPLSAFAKHKSSDWHYVNGHYWDKERRQLLPASEKPGGCPPERSGNLDRVWPLLIAAYQQERAASTRAVLLGFILHLAADAYQPLHVIAGLDLGCRSDLGGNKHCLLKNVRGKRCEDNLHRLWDSGFGEFNRPIDVVLTEIQLRLAQQKTKSRLKSLSHKIPSPADWRSDLLNVIPSVYPAKSDSTQSTEYVKKAKSISHQLTIRCVERMVELFEALYQADQVRK